MAGIIALFVRFVPEIAEDDWSPLYVVLSLIAWVAILMAGQWGLEKWLAN